MKITKKVDSNAFSCARNIQIQRGAQLIKIKGEVYKFRAHEPLEFPFLNRFVSLLLLLFLLLNAGNAKAQMSVENAKEERSIAATNEKAATRNCRNGKGDSNYLHTKKAYPATGRGSGKRKLS